MNDNLKTNFVLYPSINRIIKEIVENCRKNTKTTLTYLIGLHHCGDRRIRSLDSFFERGTCAKFVQKSH